MHFKRVHLNVTLTDVDVLTGAEQRFTNNTIHFSLFVFYSKE